MNNLITLFKLLKFGIRYYFILKNSKLNKRQRCLLLLNILDPILIEIINIRVLSTKTIASSYICINLLIFKIKDLNYQVRKQNPITFITDIVGVKRLDSFFTDTDNCYVDRVETFGEFRKESIKLLNLIERSDTSEYGYYEYTCRVLSNIIDEIFDITNKLAECLLNK